MKRKDDGFTLIELLMTVVILGILAAIAIPIYMSYRHSAEKVAAQADARTAATQKMADDMASQEASVTTAPFAPAVINQPTTTVTTPTNAPVTTPTVAPTSSGWSTPAIDLATGLRPCTTGKITGPSNKQKCHKDDSSDANWYYIDPSNDK